MKKILFLAATAMLIALASCSKGYKVSGTIEGAEDGDVVKIMALNGNQLDTLHVISIKDGKFTANGQADSTLYAIVTYEASDGSRQKSGAFFLENANIEVAFAQDEEMPIVSGTPINEKNTELSKQLYSLGDQMNQMFQERSEKEMTPEEEQDFEERFEELNQRMSSLYEDFIRNNIDNFAGQFYLANFATALDEDFVTEQLAAIPDGKESYAIRELKAQLNVKTNTAVGQPVVDFSASTPDGKSLSVAEVAQGARLLMIDFWASWCGPCRAEMPNVRAAYEQFHEQGFEILGVSLDEDAGAWKQAISTLEMTWPQISDLRGWECHGAGLYGVQAIPATVFIKDGKIVARDVRGDDLVPKIEQLLK